MSDGGETMKPCKAQSVSQSSSGAEVHVSYIETQSLSLMSARGACVPWVAPVTAEASSSLRSMTPSPDRAGWRTGPSASASGYSPHRSWTAPARRPSENLRVRPSVTTSPVTRSTSHGTGFIGIYIYIYI